MSRKAVAAITLAAFVLTSTSCMIWRTKNIRWISDVPDESAKIMSLVKTSGERIDFSSADPGRVWPGRHDSPGVLIKGTAVARFSVPVEIPRPFSSIRKRADGTVFEITDGSGRLHSVQRVLKEGDALWSVLINDRRAQPVSILLSDVRQVRFKKSYPGLTFLAVAGPTLGLLYMCIVSSLDH